MHYITVELSTAYYYLYYIIFSKQCRKGSLNVLYFFPPEICAGYQNIFIRPLDLGDQNHRLFGA